MLFVVFAWLMNEAFNLYITITYAAHQLSPINDQGPQWRFYIIGWVFPALIVIILLVTKSKLYYDRKWCFFNLDNLWINVSPMLAMLAITFLVMVFSAKEQTESSYTKNEKANKLIMYIIYIKSRVHHFITNLAENLLFLDPKRSYLLKYFITSVLILANSFIKESIILLTDKFVMIFKLFYKLIIIKTIGIILKLFGQNLFYFQFVGCFF